MKNRFTIQIRGNVEYASEAALQSKISEVLTQFPEFRLTGKNVEIWQDATGTPRLFNDDGTDYVAPVVEEAVEEPAQEETVEEATAQEETTEEVADEKKDETVVEGEG